MRDKLGWIAALFIGAAMLLAWIPLTDRTATSQAEAGLKRALGMYAVARSLNAAISVAQGTRVAVEPFGVGVELAAGEALRPIQDLVEQFSAAMLAAAAVFGIQLLLIKLGAHWALCLALSLVGATAILYWRSRSQWPRSILKLFLILTILRFAVPVSSSLSTWVHDQVLAPEQQQAEEVVTKSTSSPRQNIAPPTDLDIGSKTADLSPKSWSDYSAIVAKLSKYAEDIKRTAGGVKEMVTDLEGRAELLTESMVKVAVAFLVQTVVLPLLLAWALIAMLRAAGRSMLPRSSS